MRTFNLKGKIASAAITLSLLLGIGVALGTSAEAQWRDDNYRRQQREYEREQRRRQREYERQQRRAQRRAQRQYGYGNDGYYRNDTYGTRTRDGYGYYGGSFDLRQTALNAGYNEGMKEGRKDRDNNDRFNYTDESDYRDADKDYSSRLGDRSLYQQYFRQAFQNGYRDGYYGNTGNNSGYYPYNY